MKTLRVKEVDGEEIIVGIDRQSVDPVGTRENAAKLIKETEVYKKYTSLVKATAKKKDKLSKEINQHIANLRVFEKKHGLEDLPVSLKLGALSAKDAAQVEPFLELVRKVEVAKRKALNEMNQASKQILEVSQLVSKEQKELGEANPVFFEARGGEVIASDSQVKKIEGKLKKLKNGEVLTKKGSVIEKDLTNKRF